jgi:hypothetical protein
MKQRQAAAIGASGLFHVLLLWAVLPHTPAPQIEAGVMSASLIDGDGLANVTQPPTLGEPPVQKSADKVPAKPNAAPPPFADALPPVDPTLEPEPIGDGAVARVASSVASAAVSADGDRCALGAWLQAALQSDPTVQTALSAVPRSARSVANALMVWNGQWPQPAPDAAKGAAVIRALIVAGVRSAPESCQMQPVVGPVLITVGDPADATVLAFGSGEWRWRDLLTEPYQMQ